MFRILRIWYFFDRLHHKCKNSHDVKSDGKTFCFIKIECTFFHLFHLGFLLWFFSITFLWTSFFVLIHFFVEKNLWNFRDFKNRHVITVFVVCQNVNCSQLNRLAHIIYAKNFEQIRFFRYVLISSRIAFHPMAMFTFEFARAIITDKLLFFTHEQWLIICKYFCDSNFEAWRILFNYFE